MPTSPVTTEQLQNVQQQLEDLKRQFEEALKQEDLRQRAERLYALREDVLPSQLRAIEAQVPSIPGIPAWLTPLLQGVTVIIVIGAALWVGQITGSTNTKIDNLQKSVDKLNDWKDTASVSLGSLNQKVDDLKTKK